MPNTPNLNLPYPALSDTADVPRDIQALATSLDTYLKASTWTTVSAFTNAWSSQGAPSDPAQYTKISGGIVLLRGWITGGAPGASAFTLPAGYRPGATQAYWAVLGGTAVGFVAVRSDGTVTPLATPQTVSAWLHPIVFLAGN